MSVEFRRANTFLKKRCSKAPRGWTRGHPTAVCLGPHLDELRSASAVVLPMDGMALM